MRPQPNPRATWPSGDDNGGFYLIIILVCGCAFAYMLWSNYHGLISTAVMALHHQEIGVIRHFTSRFAKLDRQMAHADPNGVTLRDLYALARDVGTFFRIPASILMLLLAAVCMVRAAPSRFRRAFDLDGLIREQAAFFRTTMAFAGRHLRLVPLRGSDLSRGLQPSHGSDTSHGSPAGPLPADYALTPAEWIARFAPGRTGAPARTDGTGRDSSSPPESADDVGFDAAAARHALTLQLGPPWTGLDRASPPVRCLVAVFALHLAERRREALRLLGELSAALGPVGEDKPEGPERPLAVSDHAAAQADMVLRDSALARPTLALLQRHAYTHTALMTLLNEARLKSGVLSPGQFAWLKLVDRPLWYALHSIGFETEGFGRYMHPNPRVEAIGARDHWAVERIAGEPVVEPSLDRAIDALRKTAAGAVGSRPRT